MNAVEYGFRDDVAPCPKRMISGAASQNPSAGGFSIGAGIWWTLAGVIAALVGGWALAALDPPKARLRRPGAIFRPSGETESGPAGEQPDKG